MGVFDFFNFFFLVCLWPKIFRDGSNNSSGIRQAAAAERMKQNLD